MLAVAILISVVLVIAGSAMLYALVRALAVTRREAGQSWRETPVQDRRTTIIVVVMWVVSLLLAFGIAWAASGKLVAGAGAAVAMMFAWAFAAPVLGRRLRPTPRPDES